eukprot:scaffold79760_cov57-Attheya_sp.AAC.7
MPSWKHVAWAALLGASMEEGFGVIEAASFSHFARATRTTTTRTNVDWVYSSTPTSIGTLLRSTSSTDEGKSSAAAVDLPDYGKTSVEIDQFKLEKKIKRWRRKDLEGSTLITQTLTELETDEDFQETQQRLNDIGAKQMSKEERTQRRRALDKLGVPDFSEFLSQKSVSLTRADPQVLQLNIGLYCNQACAHCHVESSPLRTEEMMTAETAAQCLKLLEETPSITTLDITGGAPELNANFRYLVKMARTMRPDLDIIDRCNLTVLQEPGQGDLVPFLAENGVHIVASLPCYSEENVDTQRGSGVFERSIGGLLALNEAGYGKPSHPSLRMDLVYNPLGAFLSPEQSKLEIKYKEVLSENFGILFNQLFTMTNMPVKRFADFLYRRDELEEYMDLLVRNFNVETTKSLMCLNTISVGWDGKIFDCDFNQQLGYGIGANGIHDGGKTVFDINSLMDLKDESITNDNHCFGCTAGMGSS